MQERLQKLVGLVHAGSFTKAAQSMHISQPALTVAIAKLERELGATLLVRDTKPLELTEAGKAAYEAGLSQAVIINNLQTVISDLTERRPSVSIGMIDSVAAVLSAYPGPLRQLEEAADVSIIVNDSRQLRDATSARDLDLAIVISDRKNKEDVPIADELLVLVTSPMERFEKEAEITKGVLTNFITYTHSSTAADFTARHMAERGIAIESRLQSSSPEVMTRMVVSGGGVALLPYFIVRSHLITNALVTVRSRGEPITFERSLATISSRGKQHAQSTVALIQQIADVLQSAHAEAVKAVKAA